MLNLNTYNIQSVEKIVNVLKVVISEIMILAQTVVNIVMQIKTLKLQKLITKNIILILI